MPFQSEKQRRFLHANHPEIAKRWEREYANGGILDINASEEIISDDGNDIELTDYNAAFDDPNDLSTGVKGLFQAKDGGRIGFQGGGADRGGWGPGVGSAGTTSSGGNKNTGGGQYHGGGADVMAVSTPKSSPSTGSGRTRIQEDKQKEFQKQQIKDATKGTLSDPEEKYDTWEQEFQDIPGTLKGPQKSIYKNKVNVTHRKQILEEAERKQKEKLNKWGLGQLGKMGVMLAAMLAMGVPFMDAIKAVPKTVSLSKEDLANLVKESIPVAKAKKEYLKALGLQKGVLLGQVDTLNPNEMKSKTGKDISDITNEINDLTKTPEDDDTKGGGIELPPQLGGPSTEEMATEYAETDWLGGVRERQAQKKAYDEKIERERLAREENPIVTGTEMDIIAIGNSGGLANLFRVKNNQ